MTNVCRPHTDSPSDSQSAPSWGFSSRSSRCRACLAIHGASAILSAFAIWQIGRILPVLASGGTETLLLGLTALVATAAPLSLKSFAEIVKLKGIKK